jgi:mannan endo-1,4-beta-mannosidase
VAEAHFEMLRRCGVTCLRLMLEYCQGNHHFLERPVGRFNPRLVSMWDQLISLAERYSIRLLLTPFDTFWMWKRWQHHPYNAANGGPCSAQRELLTSPAARAAIKARMAFAIDRWGGSGAIFAWDLWNEIHPAYGEDDPGCFDGFVAELGHFVRDRELQRYGRAHPITISAFGPMLSDGFFSRELGRSAPDPRTTQVVFRHRSLDFATVHTYAHGTIDDPADTVAPAIAMARLTRAYLAEVEDQRPYFDSEHGPIHRFKDRRRMLPEGFDDEYFRHLQWAHFASGGAGGGMRWPNRRPHTLTPGMHAAQHALAGFLPVVDWRRLRRRNLNDRIRGPREFVVSGSGDEDQVVVWILRRAGVTSAGMLDRRVRAGTVELTIPDMTRRVYSVTTWNTEQGRIGRRFTADTEHGVLRLRLCVVRDLALAIRSTACDGPQGPGAGAGQVRHDQTKEEE